MNKMFAQRSFCTTRVDLVDLQKKSLAVSTVVLCLAMSVGTVHGTVIDFESFEDSFVLTDQVAGLTVSGGTVLTAGVSLNEIDFPPKSGLNALAALSGRLTVAFAEPIKEFSAYFTFGEPLLFSLFDSSGDSSGSFESPIASNLGAFTLIDFSIPGVASVLIASQDSRAFTMDDLRFNATVGHSPEPGSITLFAVAALAAVAARRRKRPCRPKSMRNVQLGLCD